jgi:hypothetical protein
MISNHGVIVKTRGSDQIVALLAAFKAQSHQRHNTGNTGGNTVRGILGTGKL